MSGSGYFYSVKMGRILSMAMEEVMGRGAARELSHTVGLEELLDDNLSANDDRSIPFETVSRMQAALGQGYGARGGGGLALRIGRAAFKYILKDYGSKLGLTETAFRLRPHPARIRIGLKSIAELYNTDTDLVVRIEDKDAQIFWRIERCPLCWQRQAEAPVCHQEVGFIQEALYWLSSGKVYNVEEIACIACGNPACTIRIDLSPIH